MQLETVFLKHPWHYSYLIPSLFRKTNRAKGILQKLPLQSARFFAPKFSKGKTIKWNKGEIK